jgi:hypothetical protein
VARSADTTEQTKSVSDPASPDYDVNSPYYDGTVDSSSSLYVGPLVGDVKSGDEIRAEVTAQVDKEDAGHSDWLSKILDPIFRDQKIQNRYENQIDQSKQGLSDGLDIRATDTAPTTLWANATHEQMNAAISQNADPATVAAASEEWVALGNDLADHQQNLAGAISSSTSNWQGSGGDAAREHLANVGKWLGSTAQGAMLTGHQQQIHSQALNETQKQMAANPPVAFSVQDANARLQTITDPVQYAAAAGQEMQVYKEQQAAREQAARAMTQFDGTVGAAVSTPAFAPPPKLPGSTGSANRGGGAGTPGAATPRSQMQPLSADMPLGANGPAGPGGLGAGGSLPGGGSPGGGDGAGGAGMPPLDTSGGGGAGGGALGGAGAGGGIAASTGGGVGGGHVGGGGVGGGAGGGVPNIPGFDSSSNLQGGSFSGSGIPGSGIPGGGIHGGGAGGVPQFDGSTTASGFSPPSPSSSGGFNAPGLNVPSMPDGSTTRGGSPFSAGGPGGGSPFTGGSPDGFTPGGIPTIGRSGGVNGDSIGSRLSGVPGPIESGSVKGSGLGGALGGSGGGAGGGGLGAGGSSGGGKGIGGIGGGASSGASSLSGGSATGGALAAQEAAAARAAAGGGAAGRGPAGASGMGGMGHGAKGKGEGDKEYRLADYLETDDPSIFAPDEAVAPPVIGDWKNTDWK